MDCPVCKSVKLFMSDRQGIEIDYCPNCRGVWLDRGELDKIIEKSATANAAPAQAAPAPAPPPPQHAYPPPQHGYPTPQHGYPPQYHRKKRKGFLGELFDFD